MSDDRDGSAPAGRPFADGGREKPNLGDYVHEPAVDADDEDPDRTRATEADRTEAGGVGSEAGDPAATDAGRTTGTEAGRRGPAGGDQRGPAARNGAAAGQRGQADGRTGPRETGPGETAPQAAGQRGPGGGARGEAVAGGTPQPTGGPRGSLGAAAPGQGRGGADGPVGGAPQDPFATPEETDVWTRVGAAVSQGGVRATAAGIAGAYGLLGAGFAMLAILVGGLGLPVLETTWNSYPLVADGALLTAVPTASLLLALFAGGYATLRHGGVDAVVAGAVGAGVGAALATALTVGAVGVVAGNATVIVGGVLVDLLLLGAVASVLAAGTTFVATRLGLSGDALEELGPAEDDTDAD